MPSTDMLSRVALHALANAMQPTAHTRQIDRYAVAHRLSWEAGCRSAQRAGRVTWTQDDLDAAAAEFTRLFAVEDA